MDEDDDCPERQKRRDLLQSYYGAGAEAAGSDEDNAADPCDIGRYGCGCLKHPTLKTSYNNSWY